ncbi:MAG: hypothetical protein KDD64_17320, partial [Bdellovibrionales bacterium]|nr:hypothetical protein [Bdellovibrionales bacterium]
MKTVQGTRSDVVGCERTMQEIAALKLLVAPFQGGRSVAYFENIASEDIPHASVLGGVRFTEELREIVASLGMRQLLISGGHCVLSPTFQREVHGYADYAKRMGLSDLGDLQKVVWADPTKTREVISALRESGAAIEPYMHREQLHRIASENGVGFFGNNERIARDVVEKFSCKVRYRTWVSDRFGETAIPLPRFSLLGNETATERHRDHLQQVLDFADRYEEKGNEPLRTKLFAQVGIAGGGVG